MNWISFAIFQKSSLDEKLPRALDDVVKRMQSQADKSYLIQTATKIEKIMHKQIIYIQKDGKNAMFSPRTNFRAVGLIMMTILF